MEKVAKCLPDFTARRNASIDTNLIRYARTQFPEMSDQLIHQNLCEIITVYHAEFTCKTCCMGIDMCSELMNTAGYTYTMTLQPSGWIKTEYAPCLFNGGKDFARSKRIAKVTQGEIFA